jgi:quercetin dioxygenase-like cupin family protein
MPFIASTDMLRSKPLRGWSGAFFHSQNMTFGLWEIAGDADPLHEHSHPQEEVWNVAEGEIAITVDGKEHILRPGSAIVVPPDVRHSARPLGRCRAIVADWPVRSELPGLIR